MTDSVNRRALLSGLLTGGAAAALTRATPAEAALPATGEVDVALPPGIVQLTSPQGETMEVAVPSGIVTPGIVTFEYLRLQLLRGLWQIYKPGAIVYNKLNPTSPFFDSNSTRGTFDLIDSHVVPPSTVYPSTAAWAYRNPIDHPGTVLRGYQGRPMVLWVNTGGPVPALTIQLLELDVFQVATYADLQNLPFPFDPRVFVPPVRPFRRILASWYLPAGNGSREIPVPPIIIPWNTRLLALRRLPASVPHTVYVRLMATDGNQLEIVPEVTP